jgi:hypothetical protein
VSRTYVAPISHGLGDLVVSVPVIQAAIAAGAGCGDETWLVARSPSQAALAGRIAGLGGCVAEEDLPSSSGDLRLVDLRDHPLQRDYWWGSRRFEAAYGPLDINQILARIAADFGIAADFTRPRPLEWRHRPSLCRTVLLVAETDGPAKAWSAEKWSSLATQLGARFDVRYVTRSGPSGPLRGSGIGDVRAPSPGAAVDALSSCQAVIGVDTGLTHIAVQQGTPTVMICRRNSVFFRPWSHARALRGTACDDACLAADEAASYNDRVSLRGFDWKPRQCPVGGRCLSELAPQQAMALLDELL